MPLDSPEAYERLGEHLKEIDPIIDDFCRETGFVRRTFGVSRYPARLLDLRREVSWCIELRMEDGDGGQRYDHFFPDIPYTLGGGAWLDRDGHRYFDVSTIAFTRLPFSQLAARLGGDLRKTWERIRHFTPDYLVGLGPREFGLSGTHE
jgi:hypothetical protein